ncbi:chemotaxis response regulator protein-glutamate methylesterase [Enterococcus sp.]|uniref:protein-glutamate methylesterase/protein-glutamine glutaminase n=1 Tax=Enterococcus sp. TaxID=35783 RepID=UPI0025BFE6F6|nr:chemotaxis response regulator protein-glutamate methylesterase [Enterococcus sp.]
MKRVLIVDDSAFMRKVVTDLLEQMPEIKVAAVARNGKQALDQLAKETFDLVVMDVEMPVMNGIETLRMIKQQYTVPVIMLSSLTNQETTIECLELGATDFVEKPVNLSMIEQDWINDFYKKIDSLDQNHSKEVKTNTEEVKLSTRSLPRMVEAVVIGSSTGGPRALLGIIRRLPKRLHCPIIIVQHMPAGFTASFAQRLNTETTVPVKEVTEGMAIENQVYLCPGDYHMTIRQGRFHLDQREKLHGTRPAVDYLFTSAASVYQDGLVGVLLTGMGKDGAKGMQTIQQKGGYTIAQDKDSCVVFGMPRYAIEQNAVDEVLALRNIEIKIGQMVG